LRRLILVLLFLIERFFVTSLWHVFVNVLNLVNNQRGTYNLSVLSLFGGFVCVHGARPPSIRIRIGSKYEMYHLKGG